MAKKRLPASLVVKKLRRHLYVSQANRLAATYDENGHEPMLADFSDEELAELLPGRQVRWSIELADLWAGPSLRLQQDAIIGKNGLVIDRERGTVEFRDHSTKQTRCVRLGRIFEVSKRVHV